MLMLIVYIHSKKKSRIMFFFFYMFFLFFFIVIIFCVPIKRLAGLVVVVLGKGGRFAIDYAIDAAFHRFASYNACCNAGRNTVASNIPIVLALNSVSIAVPPPLHYPSLMKKEYYYYHQHVVEVVMETTLLRRTWLLRNVV